MTPQAGIDELRGALLLRPERLAHAERRPDPRDARLAREALRAARRALHATNAFFGRLGALVNQGVGGIGMMGGTGRHGAEPAARRHGRHRQPAVLQARVHEPHQHASWTPLYVIPTADRKRPRSGSHAEAARRPDLFHRSDERPARGARPGVDPSGPHGPPRLVPDADAARPARRLRPVHQRRSRTSPSWTRRSGATSSRASPTGTPRRRSSRCARWRSRTRTMRARAEFDWDDIVEAMTTVESGHGGQHRLRARRRRERSRSTRPATPSPGTCT